MCSCKLARREAALVQKPNARNERVVKGRHESLELLLGRIRDIVQPLPHESPQELADSVGRRRIHLRHSANQHALVELARPSASTPIDMSSHDVLEPKARPGQDFGVEAP